MSINSLLNKAADASQDSDMPYNLGCCIFKKGNKKIVSGCNHSRTTHRGFITCSTHAECHAVMNFFRVIRGKNIQCLLRPSPDYT